MLCKEAFLKLSQEITEDSENTMSVGDRLNLILPPLIFPLTFGIAIQGEKKDISEAIGPYLEKDYKRQDLIEGLEDIIRKRKINYDPNFIPKPGNKIQEAIAENGPHYNTFTNKIVFPDGSGNKNPYILAHELGHAKDKILSNAPINLVKVLGRGAGIGLTGAGLYNLIKNDRLDAENRFEPAALVNSGVAAHTLAQEAIASGSAYRTLKKLDPNFVKGPVARKELLKVLGLPYLSYSLGALRSVMTPLSMALMLKLNRKMENKDQ